MQRSKASHNTNIMNGNINIRGNRNIININKKSLFVIISENGKNHCILEFLKKKKLLNKIVIFFLCLGLRVLDCRAYWYLIRRAIMLVISANAKQKK